MKRNELKIELLVPLEGKRTSLKKKAELQRWIAERLEEELSLILPETLGTRREPVTYADKYKVGSMILTSEAGMDEVCV